MKYTHTRSCDPVQRGHGLSRYKGIPYQEGYGLYQGQVFQRGHGLGGTLGNLFKATIRPALKKAKDMLLPVAKRVGKAAAERAGKKAVSMALERKLRKDDIKQALKDELKNAGSDAIKELTGILPNILQSERSRAAPRKRKRKIRGQTTRSKRQRRTIFD